MIVLEARVAVRADWLVSPEEWSLPLVSMVVPRASLGVYVPLS
jgi:hypothetical protein